MRARTDTPSSSDLGTSPKRAGERLETTGDLELGCIMCHRDIPASETVIFWPVDGGRFAVAHVDCALPPAPRGAP